jgi:hypothetical protein
VRSLRHRGDRVDVRGEARLGGVAVRTLPLTFTATAGEDAVSAEADVAAPRDGWHPFSARVPLPRADGSEAVQLSAAVGVAPEVTAELPGLPPAAGARPPLRSRVGTRALLDAGDRLSRHPVVLPARRRAIALVRERSGVRAVYRRLRRAGRA